MESANKISEMIYAKAGYRKTKTGIVNIGGLYRSECDLLAKRILKLIKRTNTKTNDSEIEYRGVKHKLIG